MDGENVGNQPDHPEPTDTTTGGNVGGYGPVSPNGGRPSTPEEHAHIDQRRHHVERLDLQGWSTRAIAAELGVDPETVRRDLKAIRKARADWWDEVTLEDERRKELERLERLYRVWLPRAVSDDADTNTAVATAMCLKIADRKAKLMGLDQPTKIAGPDGGPLRVELAVSDELALDIVSRALGRREAALN